MNRRFKFHVELSEAPRNVDVYVSEAEFERVFKMLFELDYVLKIHVEEV